MNAPKTPATKATRFTDVSPATPFTPFSARYAFSSPAYSTPASSVNPSPAFKPKPSLADIAINWRDRASVKPLPLVTEEDVVQCLLPAPSLVRSHVHNSLFSSDSSASDDDSARLPAAEPIRVSLPKPSTDGSARTQPRSLLDALDVSSTHFHAQTFAIHPSPAQTPANSSCFVCGLVSSSSERGALTVLKPCSHLLCRACLTQTLNIVGEKTFACACGVAISDFYLVSSSTIPSPVSSATTPAPGIASLLLGPRIVCPPSVTVLRIDNCPWDVSPPMLTAWCAPHGIIAAHVMLDRKGKTLSHAFVECPSAEEARAMMRTCRTKILGSGRRARGVTLTLSSQEELAKNLFPTWEGPFDGTDPTLEGVPIPTAHSLLARGVLSSSELESLLDLIQHPDSMFLKSPSLPYYVLASLLNKAPAGELFMLPAVRARLFHVTVAALDRLLSGLGSRMYDDDALAGVITAARICRTFTLEQRAGMDEVARFLTAPRA